MHFPFILWSLACSLFKLPKCETTESCIVAFELADELALAIYKQTGSFPAR